MTRWRDRLRRTFYELRLEGEGPGREAAALGLGVFIGCTPLYGFHLILCWIAGWALRLNRLKLYLAANISNPLFAPFLIFIELQTGAWIRRSDLHDLSIAARSAAVDVEKGTAATRHESKVTAIKQRARPSRRASILLSTVRL